MQNPNVLSRLCETNDALLSAMSSFRGAMELLYTKEEAIDLSTKFELTVMETMGFIESTVGSIVLRSYQSEKEKTPATPVKAKAMQTEIWKSVPGYEGIYEASTLGNVRSIDRVQIYCNGRQHKMKGQQLKQMKCVQGMFVTLSHNREQKVWMVADIIANTFLNGKPNGDAHAVHKSENIFDNRPCNLRWEKGKTPHIPLRSSISISVRG